MQADLGKGREAHTSELEGGIIGEIGTRVVGGEEDSLDRDTYWRQQSGCWVRLGARI